MTVYKAYKPEAAVSAEIAIDLAEGKEIPQGKVTDELDNEAGKVPSILFEPIAVTKDNIKQTVIADEEVSVDELCTGPYVKPCEEAGIS